MHEIAGKKEEMNQGRKEKKGGGGITYTNNLHEGQSRKMRQ